MENIKILSAWGWETNPHANPETSDNGGGYSQLFGGCLLAKYKGIVCVEIHDQSCGSFGTRISVDIDAPDAGMRWYANVGDMDDASIDTQEQLDDIVASIWGVVGLDLFDLIDLGLSAAKVCAY